MDFRVVPYFFIELTLIERCLEPSITTIIYVMHVVVIVISNR